MCMNSNGNEKIEVHDASILRSNEHPKFKIGDVINNGYGDFTVKGFTRSFLGLAYVLDNGSKIIGWLTEQVDAKCHLVERNHSEYIRKYFFIEKACNLIAKMVLEVTYRDLEDDSVEHYDKTEFVEDFRRYLESKSWKIITPFNSEIK